MASYTGVVNTNGEFVSLATTTGFSFSEGNTYSMQIQNTAYLKVGNAVFCFRDEKFQYKASSDDLKIKTYGDVVVSILENA